MSYTKQRNLEQLKENLEILQDKLSAYRLSMRLSLDELTNKIKILQTAYDKLQEDLAKSEVQMEGDSLVYKPVPGKAFGVNTTRLYSTDLIKDSSEKPVLFSLKMTGGSVLFLSLKGSHIKKGGFIFFDEILVLEGIKYIVPDPLSPIVSDVLMDESKIDKVLSLTKIVKDSLENTFYFTNPFSIDSSSKPYAFCKVGEGPANSVYLLDLNTCKVHVMANYELAGQYYKVPNDFTPSETTLFIRYSQEEGFTLHVKN